MNVIDPGHNYVLQSLDNAPPQILQFSKRIGPNYPGNEPPAYHGTNCQEPLRAIFDRCRYLSRQFWCVETTLIVLLLLAALWLFEFRAARIHRRWPPRRVINGPICPICGHVGCLHGWTDIQ